LRGDILNDIITKVAKIIDESDNIVFFGGAGVSTECGIPDFRSANGLYNKVSKYNYSPEVILSHSFFQSHPDIFYDFLNNNLLKYSVSPNKGHRALEKLEHLGKIKAVVTQNIDNLHQIAGSKMVLELHGTLARFYCSKCLKNYSTDYVKSLHTTPICECGGVIRPDIVLYEEALDERILVESIQYINNAEILIVAGTSLAVQPAAGLLRYFKGKHMIFINKEGTDYDKKADILIHKPFAETMNRIMLTMGLWKKTE
jgi:NAD-dependent deacetylase